MLIGLASGLGQQVHLCHVSLAAEIALTRAGKEPGARVTCEVTPHHLFVNEDGAQRLGP